MKMEARRLRKIVAGSAEKNFGNSVARPDGLSKAAICRATELPDNHNGRRTRRRKRKALRPTEA
jgi:DNA mismatch repair ATPase MutS